MSTAVAESDHGVRSLPIHRLLPELLRDPANVLAGIGDDADGEIVRLNLGPVRHYLVSHPDHVQHVLRGSSANFTRSGSFWRPLHRLFGTSVMSDGETWALSRGILQPVFTARNVNSLTGRMAEAIAEGVAEWEEAVEAGQPIHVPTRIADVVNKTVIRILFADKITLAEAERIAPAFDSVATATILRAVLPFVPNVVPMPGDRAFRRALRTVDDVVFPLVRKYRGRPTDDQDIFSVLARARDADGGELDEQWMRGNLVAMFATATETTVGALTWLWPLLARHPEVTSRLYEEIDRVVGDGPVGPSHLADLVYTKQVIQEVLRLHPVGWLFPRAVVEPEVIGGVRFRSGDTLLISPYVTHRLTRLWDRPEEFDPDRFAPEQTAHRHRYAYFPFGGGPHQCLGMHLFNLESQLIVATILSRFRLTSCVPTIATPQAAASLRPREEVEITLRPTTRLEK
ncbi:cytochrome P450 [Microtetraspora malaysiensis]|uniref:cytochrome P450 n=1 Tax=Microtetraspora malaysiensis TaxID=161358 RepID=UPI0008321B2D|nr:cytochrome P450 [Microtetraspora malaysiensis]